MRTLNSTALSVSWEDPPSIRGVRVGFLLQYMLSPQDSYLLPNNSTTMNFEVDSLQAILAGLHEFANYTVNIQAQNDKGLGEVSSQTGMTDQSGKFQCFNYVNFFSIFFLLNVISTV